MNYDDASIDEENQHIPDSLKLALLAASLTGVADVLAAISAVIAIDEEKESINQDAKDKQELEIQLESMQQQIDELMNQNQDQMRNQNYLLELVQSMQRQIDELKNKITALVISIVIFN